MKPKTDPLIAVAYLRVSTDAERQANGLEVQRQAIERFAAGRGLTVACWCQDELSGRTEGDQRPGFLEALGELRQRRAGALLVHRIDRLARDMTEGLLMERTLQRFGVDLLAVEGNGDKTPAGKLLRNVALAAAAFEGDMIRARIKNTKALLRSQGRFEGGEPPYGWTVQGERGARMLVKDPAEQELIERFCALRKQGLSFRQMQRRAAIEGWTNRAGSPWDLASISRLVKRATAG